MRAFALGLVFSVVAVPCLAQTVLKSEPLILSPYEVAFVQDASCPAGKVLKVTGAIRGLHRRKACVSLASEQASLAKRDPVGSLPRSSRRSTRMDRIQELNCGSLWASRSASAWFLAGSSCGSGLQGLIS